jgi:hypothetical protein
VLGIKVPGDPIKYTTTVTTGVIAVSTNIVYTLISSFTTRFAAWDEYRVVRVQFKVRMFSSTNPGVVRVWVEDRLSSAPTLATAEAAKGLFINASCVNKEHLLDYKIYDPVYTDFTALNATQSVGYLNVYTNNANYGASTVATDYLMITPMFTFQFRGFA